MSKRTLFLIFALFIITFVLLLVTLYKPASPEPAPQVMAPKESIEQTVLSFGQPAATASSSIGNVAYSLPINIATGSNSVTAVQLELQYDPEVLTNVSVTSNSFFKNPTVLLNEIDTKTGRITYAFGVGIQDQGMVGKGVAATLNFEARAGTPKETTILFLPKTLVTAEETDRSVVKQTNNITLIVGEKISTPSAQ